MVVSVDDIPTISDLRDFITATPPCARKSLALHLIMLAFTHKRSVKSEYKRTFCRVVMAPPPAATKRLLQLGALLLDASALDTLPTHLRGGAVWEGVRSEQKEQSVVGAPRFIEVPLDHFNATSSAHWQLKFFVDDSHWAPGGVLLVTMPSEGATDGCRAGTLAAMLHAACVCSQHRYFGDSVPHNDSSTAALAKYLSIEQNLADIAALIVHARRRLYPAASATVVMGGSYAGASSAWMRRAYPTLVDAAIAQSPPVTATYSFPEYDTSNLVALSSPDYRCAHAEARVAAALTSLLSSEPAKLMELFGAAFDATSPTGTVDFAYALGDSVASAVQYGRKSMLCEALQVVYGDAARAGGGTADYGDAWALASLFANYTRRAWGAAYFSGCFYNSTCMRSATRGSIAESARSWYFLKCTQLGYLQVAPASGLATRPAQLTTRALMEQCKYIFGPEAPLLTPAKVAAFNEQIGGGDIGKTSRIFEIDYSDDPWKMATTTAAVQRQAWPLTTEQPFMLLTCDGCGHCGAGVPASKRDAIDEQAAAALAAWGITGSGP